MKQVRGETVVPVQPVHCLGQAYKHAMGEQSTTTAMRRLHIAIVSNYFVGGPHLR
jgi:hypothetical protein